MKLVCVIVGWCWCVIRNYTVLQVFLVRKVVGKDAGKLYAMKVLKKASLKGRMSHNLVAYMHL